MHSRNRSGVLVITGDGDMLMGAGQLCHHGASKRPANLAIVVMDNEHYGETGMQQTHTASGVDLAAIATACRHPHLAHRPHDGRSHRTARPRA